MAESRPPHLEAITRIAPEPVAFQGVSGAYSDLACRHAFPNRPTLPCDTFEDAMAAVREGRAGLAMLPIDNTLAGRVADVYHLIPNSGLHIVGEHYQPIHHNLLVRPGVKRFALRTAHSHVHALSQCRGYLRGNGLRAVVEADTAGSARWLAGDATAIEAAVIASELAADIYGLEILDRHVEDATHNTTRFLAMAREAVAPERCATPCMTTFVFRVRSVPAALYKALGGFATNGVNMTKLESYIVGGHFDVAQFYADIEGHPEDRPIRLALEELDFFSREVRILGVYPANPFRLTLPPQIDV